MASIRLNDGRIIGDELEPYFVAEVNSSHNGKVDLAKEMIDKALEIGCDCIKFQSWSKETLYSKTYYNANPISKRIVDKFSLAFDEQQSLAKYSESVGLPFASTPYSNEEVDFLLDKCHVPFIKVASMDINNLDFLRYIAKKDTAIVLATGMATEEEIVKAVECIREEGNNRLCLLHCIAIYPSTPDMMQMKYITRLKELFPDIPIGFSDHTLGCEVACAAIALGACFVEKHFTLDSSKMGMDNNMATEPNVFKNLIDSCKNVYIAMGYGVDTKNVSDVEIKQRENMRRSVVAARDLPSGYIITREDMIAKRPGTGISVSDIEKVVGRKLMRDVEADTLILWEDLE